MLEIIPLPALKQHYNYIWVLKNKTSRHVAIVDPGEAPPLLRLIADDKLIPIAILITHHHWDHVNGIADLIDQYALPVYTPKTESIIASTHPVGEGDRVSLPDLNLELQILDVPGHTLGAIAYYTHDLVFSGDTLFTGGCGRLFEGTPSQMYASLSRFKSLSKTSLLYCGHEYTVANLEFAMVVEPNNKALQARLAAARELIDDNKPTVPESLALEAATNPFLRCDKQAVMQAVQRHSGKELNTAVEVFTELRRWNDGFH